MVLLHGVGDVGVQLLHDRVVHDEVALLRELFDELAVVHDGVDTTAVFSHECLRGRVVFIQGHPARQNVELDRLMNLQAHQQVPTA